MWALLAPLMKPDIFGDVSVKKRLLDLVMSKDNTGEAMWYVYTAVLVTSIVYYNLATRGCVRDAKTIKANYDKYLAEQSNKNNATPNANNV